MAKNEIKEVKEVQFDKEGFKKELGNALANFALPIPYVLQGNNSLQVRPFVEASTRDHASEIIAGLAEKYVKVSK